MDSTGSEIVALENNPRTTSSSPAGIESASASCCAPAGFDLFANYIGLERHQIGYTLCLDIRSGQGSVGPYPFGTITVGFGRPRCQ
jgi:hypothetical protein